MFSVLQLFRIFQDGKYLMLQSVRSVLTETAEIGVVLSAFHAAKSSADLAALIPMRRYGFYYAGLVTFSLTIYFMHLLESLVLHASLICSINLF